MKRPKDLAIGMTTPPSGTWIQTDRDALKAMTALANTNPRALGLLTAMIANMQRHNALVASHATLARISNSSPRTVRRALTALRDANWIQIRQIGEAGTVNAYIINDRVAWTGTRDGIRYSLFTAEVLVTDAEQATDHNNDLDQALTRVPRLTRTPPQQIEMEAYIAKLDSQETAAETENDEPDEKSEPDEPLAAEIDAAFRKQGKK